MQQTRNDTIVQYQTALNTLLNTQVTHDVRYDAIKVLHRIQAEDAGYAVDGTTIDLLYLLANGFDKSSRNDDYAQIAAVDVLVYQWIHHRSIIAKEKLQLVTEKQPTYSVKYRLARRALNDNP